MPADSFGAAGTLTAGGSSYRIFQVHAVEGAARLPYCLKVLLENLLRNSGGHLVTAAQIQALAGWDPAAEPSVEIAFPRPGCCCRTSPGCRAWSTWPRCGRRWLSSAGTPRR